MNDIEQPIRDTQHVADAREHYVNTVTQDIYDEWDAGTFKLAMGILNKCDHAITNDFVIPRQI